MLGEKTQRKALLALKARQQKVVSHQQKLYEAAVKTLGTRGAKLDEALSELDRINALLKDLG